MQWRAIVLNLAARGMTDGARKGTGKGGGGEKRRGHAEATKTSQVGAKYAALFARSYTHMCDRAITEVFGRGYTN